jgi:TPR repeat protein
MDEQPRVCAVSDQLTRDIDFLRKAADNGNAEAMFLLGVCYARGKKVAQDHTAAAKWFHEASRKGHAAATTSLGFLYARGRGVRLDQKLAYKLISDGQQRGDTTAPELLAKLRQQMSPPMLKEAERMVANQPIA